MTFQQAINPDEVIEEPFGIEEILFSRSDKRGVIRSGNRAFQQVADLPWERLIGAPHRLIRHPDTPKATFALMWKTIQQGRPFMAFVKNRSSSGKSYWVLTAVMPIDDGYFSLGIKPTGTLFALAQSLYAEITAAEQTQGLAPEKSCELMLQRLEEMGFRTYSEFVSKALEEEISLRDTALGRGNMARSQVQGAIISSLAGTQDQLLREFLALQAIPTNMRIIASRLEPSGGPISAISDNYKYASNEISLQLDAFAGSKANFCQSMAELVTEATILSDFDRPLSDLVRQFASEDRNGMPVEFSIEMDLLAKIQRSFSAMAKDAMIQVDVLSGELYQAAAGIRRMMLGLDTIRVMGRVESGRLGMSEVGLASTIDQLGTRHGEIARSLQRLMDLSGAIKAGINAYLRDHAGWAAPTAALHRSEPSPRPGSDQTGRN